VSDALDAVSVTAQRVHRFADEVEHDPTDINRKLWRAALRDFRETVRRARAEGHETAEIQSAAGDAAPRRFAPSPGEPDTPPRRAAAG
jgi:hypothetical protein